MDRRPPFYIIGEGKNWMGGEYYMVDRDTMEEKLRVDNHDCFILQPVNSKTMYDEQLLDKVDAVFLEVEGGAGGSSLALQELTRLKETNRHLERKLRRVQGMAADGARKDLRVAIKACLKSVAKVYGVSVGSCYYRQWIQVGFRGKETKRPRLNTST